MAKKCASGKIRFKRKQDAANKLQLIIRNTDGRQKVRDIYPCSECNGYHLTSNPRHGTKTRVDRSFSMADLKSHAMELRQQQLIEPMQIRGRHR